MWGRAAELGIEEPRLAPLNYSSASFLDTDMTSGHAQKSVCLQKINSFSVLHFPFQIQLCIHTYK